MIVAEEIRASTIEELVEKLDEVRKRPHKITPVLSRVLRKWRTNLEKQNALRADRAEQLKRSYRKGR